MWDLHVLYFVEITIKLMSWTLIPTTPIRYRYSLIKPEKNIMIFQNITVYKGNLFFLKSKKKEAFVHFDIIEKYTRCLK